MQIEHPETAEPLAHVDLYKTASVTIAWLVRDGKRYLVFGLVQGVATERPPPPAFPEMERRLRISEKWAGFCLQRWTLPFVDALTWYEAAREGVVVIPPVDDGDDRKDIASGALMEEPAWPALIAAPEVPFARGADRLHSLYDQEPHPILEKLTDPPDAISWLSERLHFDLTAYSEYVGSFHLLLEDPILREVNHRLGIDEHGGEYSEIELILRAGQTLDGLSLIVEERRVHGPVDVRAIPVTSPFIKVYHAGRVDKVGLSVRHERLGLLRYDKPVGFLRSISTTLEVGEGKKHVQPSPDAERDPPYEVPIHRVVSETLYGETTPPSSPDIRLRQVAHQREKLADAERLGQKMFFGDKITARKTIRDLIGSARHRVMIFDPYFASLELYNFALATRSLAATVSIITSSEHLKGVDSVDASGEAGEVLERQLAALPPGHEIDAYVLTGDPPPLHDRFLVIDEEVWFSGNSLHNLGQRFSLLINLPYPEPVLEALAAMKTGDRCRPFLDWIRERKTARGPKRP